MADVTPNYSLEIQGLELEMAQLNLNVQSQQYRIAQTRDEVARITTNIEATKVAIATIAAKILGLKGNT